MSLLPYFTVAPATIDLIIASTNFLLSDFVCLIKYVIDLAVFLATLFTCLTFQVIFIS